MGTNTTKRRLSTSHPRETQERLAQVAKAEQACYDEFDQLIARVHEVGVEISEGVGSVKALSGSENR